MTDSTKAEQSLSMAWEENRIPIIALAFCFILSHMLAMFIVPAYEEAEVQAFEDPEDPINSVVYIGIILVFTAFILWIAKKRPPEGGPEPQTSLALHRKAYSY